MNTGNPSASDATANEAIDAVRTLQIANHRIALVVPFTFPLERTEALQDFDDRLLASAPAIDPAALPAGLCRMPDRPNGSQSGQPPQPDAVSFRWRRYAGARNDAPQRDGPINPAYYSLYPQAQHVVQHPLEAAQPGGESADPKRDDALLCLPYSLPLHGLYWPETPDAATPAVRLHSARLMLFRTGIGLLLLLMQSGPDDLRADNLLAHVRALAEPYNVNPESPHARISSQLDALAQHLLHHAIPGMATPHLRRKTWVSAAHVPSASHAQLQRLALLLSHRQNTAYALRPEQVQEAVYAPFDYVAHAVSIGGAASVVSDAAGAQPFVDIFVDRVWSHTYLPLLLLPLHQHYFYLRHAEWEPLSPRAHHAARELEERYEDYLDFQAHFASALVGQIDLHNAYVRIAAAHLRLHERVAEFERATHDYAGMLRVRGQRRLRILEIGGSFAAVFIIVREVLEAAMQNGFFGDVPESRAWYAQLNRWSPQKITEMIERVHHWDQAIFSISLSAAIVAAVLAWWFDRRIGKE